MVRVSDYCSWGLKWTQDGISLYHYISDLNKTIHSCALFIMLIV